MSALLDAVPATRWLRDPTRGGVASICNELAAASGLGVELDEGALPVRGAVAGACELLGLDPLYIANEGKMVAVVPAEDAEAAVEAMRSCEVGADACVVGTITDEHPGLVLVRTGFGGTRIVDMLVGDPLPRIADDHEPCRDRALSAGRSAVRCVGAGRVRASWRRAVADAGRPAVSGGGTRGAALGGPFAPYGGGVAKGLASSVGGGRGLAAPSGLRSWWPAWPVPPRPRLRSCSTWSWPPPSAGGHHLPGAPGAPGPGRRRAGDGGGRRPGVGARLQAEPGSAPDRGCVPLLGRRQRCDGQDRPAQPRAGGPVEGFRGRSGQLRIGIRSRRGGRRYRSG